MYIYRTAWRSIPEDRGTLHSNGRENLKSELQICEEYKVSALVRIPLGAERFCALVAMINIDIQKVSGLGLPLILK
jgi:hypothetical protein